MFQNILGHVVFFAGMILVTFAAHLIGDVPTIDWRTIEPAHMAAAFYGFTLGGFGLVMVATAPRD